MKPTVAETASLIRALLGADAAATKRSLEEYLAGIPRLDALANVAAGTPVLVRGDLDAKPGAKIGDGDERLRSMLDTLKYGQSRGWKQILFGHIGRKPEQSLDSVGKRLGELLGASVTLVPDWLDEEKIEILPDTREAIARAPQAGFVLLENTRKYKLERLLWDATADQADALAEPLSRLAAQFRQHIAKVYVNEALSAGSLDASSTIIPAGMDQVALGRYVAGEFDGPMLRCRRARMVVFSGLKLDKLDDLEAVVGRGSVKMVFVAGSLAMALMKARAQIAGGDFHVGVAQEEANASQDWFISPKRVEQAQQMLTRGKQQGIEFVLPVDLVLANGSVSEAIGPGKQQLDVGPKTSEYFAKKVGEFIAANQPVPGQDPAVVFHNGVFGYFEKPEFQAGTRRFMSELKRLKDAGLEVYVGGGEGGKALKDFGAPDWITHCFTAGGTVLNALGGQPVPYLLALHRAATV